ncbi:thymidylate synthase [Glycomyces sp. A-F 0318]|uniref:thymidylate synthase n=1 Tax=Glycomyces amatae TaxID=2881355 RepID=UPI001E36DCFA|nr:thymidylate synthase [Glycomyces amatae]
MEYPNVAHAFISELRTILSDGHTVSVRGNSTKEVLDRTIRIKHSGQRCITLPARNNNIFATIAETMWVLAGRNDLQFLSHYLPRASDFSDDGETWRAGYGPRLRDWNGVDQVSEVLSILRSDPDSRRAVITLYDPDRDFIDSKDIPCNNWIHFMLRDGRLDMSIAIRSNDIIWGFSGINTFEWSVLQEMMAHWLGAKTGYTTYFISSLHLYQKHYTRAERIITQAPVRSEYADGWTPRLFKTSWENFHSILDLWFEIEGRIRAGDDVTAEISNFPDPLLGQFIAMMNINGLRNSGAPQSEIKRLIEAMGRTDLAFAANANIFGDPRTQHSFEEEDDSTLFRRAIIALHEEKSQGYRNAWKKRGEQLSIIPNIARKIDRLEVIRGGADPGRESLLDTTVDLFVYVLKYQTFLADQSESVAQSLFANSRMSPPYSDDTRGFEALIASKRVPSHNSRIERSVGDAIDDVLADFSELEQRCTGDLAPIQDRADSASDLSRSCTRLIEAVWIQDPTEFRRYLDQQLN